MARTPEERLEEFNRKRAEEEKELNDAMDETVRGLEKDSVRWSWGGSKKPPNKQKEELAGEAIARDAHKQAMEQKRSEPKPGDSGYDDWYYEKYGYHGE